MSRNDTSAIYKSTYYLRIVHVKLTNNQKALRSFNLPSCFGKHFVWNTFGTPVWPLWSLTWDRSFWVARHTFLWVLSTHRNFTKDLGMLRKSLQTVWRPCQWFGLHPSPSLPFNRFMYKYKAKPPSNNKLFTSYIALKLRIYLNISMFWFTPLKLTLTRSVQFIIPIFRLDSFALSWTKISS
jgi:hypothetical protein